MTNDRWDSVARWDGSAAHHTARVHYDRDQDQWSGSDSFYALLGLPANVPLSTAALVERQHPEDRDRVGKILLASLADGQPFSVAHRVVRPDGVVREALLAGESVVGEDGGPAGVRGYVVDLTAELERRARRAADEAVAAAVATRGAIEQAKGVLRVAYGLADAEAFAMLADWSSRKNVKVNVLSDRLVEVVGLGAASSQALRTRLDQVLETITRVV